MNIKVSEEEINEVLNHCTEAEESGVSNYPGMLYEEGIKAAIQWLEGGDYPFD